LTKRSTTAVLTAIRRVSSKSTSATGTLPRLDGRDQAFPGAVEAPCLAPRKEIDVVVGVVVVARLIEWRIEDQKAVGDGDHENSRHVVEVPVGEDAGQPFNGLTIPRPSRSERNGPRSGKRLRK